MIDVIARTARRERVPISIAIGGASDLASLKFMTRVGKDMAIPGKESAAPPRPGRRRSLAFVGEHQLDGVDLDLEGWWGQSAAEDQGGRPLGQAHPAGSALTALARKLRKASPRLLISAAGFGTSWYGNNYDWKIVDSLDWIGLMTYDLTGSWKASPVGPHSALRVIRDQGAYEAEPQGPWPVGPEYNAKEHGPRPDYNPIQSAEESLWYWTNPLYANWQGRGQSIPRQKVALGVPAYGYDFSTANPELGTSDGQLPYKDILKEFPDAFKGPGNIKVAGETDRPPVVNQPGRYPYRRNIYFETPASAVAKLEFARRVGGQGVIVWDVTQDALGDERSILRALSRASGGPPAVRALQMKSDALEDGGRKVVIAWTDKDNNIRVKVGDADPVKLGEQSRTAPTLASTGKKLHFAWTGTDRALNVVSSDDGTRWGDKVTIPGRSTDWSPSLAANPATGELLLAWGTWGADLQVRSIRSADGKEWKDNQVEALKGDNRGIPGLAFTRGKEPKPVFGWGGIRREAKLRISFDRERATVLDEYLVILPQFDEGWAVTHPPAVAATKDRVHVAWTGQGDGTLNILSSADGRHWNPADKKEFKDYSSKDAVAMAADPVTDELIMAWSDKGGKGVQTLRIDPKQGSVALKSRSVGADVHGLPAVTVFRKSPWMETASRNAYVYCQLDDADTRGLPVAETKSVRVEPGAHALYAVLFSNPTSAAFPAGAWFEVEGPDGATFRPDQGPDVHVFSNPEGSTRALIVKSPPPGNWKVRLTIPGSTDYHFELATVPSNEAADVIVPALAKLYESDGVKELKKRLFGVDDLVVGVAFAVLFAIGGVAATSSMLTPLEAPNPTPHTLAFHRQVQVARNNLTSGSTAPGPSQGARVAVRVGTWNIYPRTLRNNPAPAPIDRIRRIAEFGRTHNIHVIALQEVPRSLDLILPAMIRELNDQSNRPIRYNLIWINREYDSINSANTSSSGYAVLYNPAVLRVAAGSTPGLFEQRSFPRGASFARPPASVSFEYNDSGTYVPFTFYTWHAEANTVDPTTQDEGVALGLFGNRRPWILAGDLNIPVDRITGPRSDLRVPDSVHLAHNGPSVDHIVVSDRSRVDDIQNHLDGVVFDGSDLTSDGYHLALFGVAFLPRVP